MSKLPVVGSVFLQLAFACLVADGAVQRVVGEQELQHGATRFGTDGAIGADAHILGHCVGAGHDGSRHPLNGLITVLIVSGCGSGCETRGHALLHQAHAAGTRHAQLGMVAEARHMHAHAVAGIGNAGAFGEAVPSAVNLHIDLAFGGGCVLRQYLLFCTHGSAVKVNLLGSGICAPQQFPDCAA